METGKFFIYLIVMAGVTYLIRALPLALCRNKVKNRFVQSFLAYVPYAVLAAMTFPAVLYSAGEFITGLAGTAAGLIFAYKRKSLLMVAVVSCAAAFVAEVLCMLL